MYGLVKSESVLCKKYNLDTLQRRREIQLGCMMYRLSKNETYIDYNVYSENLRSENKMKFICSLARNMRIRKKSFLWGRGLVEQFEGRPK